MDGSKFRAVNGNKKMYNQEILTKKLERISVKLREYMDRLDREDKSEDTADDDDKKDHTYLSDKILQLQERQKLYEEYCLELSESGQTQKLGDYLVTNHINDQGILQKFSE